MLDKTRNGVDLEFDAKFGQFWGNPKKYKGHTSTGRKFAPVEGLSHDSESVPDRIFVSTLRGRCGTVKLSPNFLYVISYEGILGWKSDQNQADKRILGGKGCSTKAQQASLLSGQCVSIVILLLSLSLLPLLLGFGRSFVALALRWEAPAKHQYMMTVCAPWPTRSPAFICYQRLLTYAQTTSISR